MNTDEIYNILSGDAAAKRVFGGVMAADEFANVYAGFRRLAQATRSDSLSSTPTHRTDQARTGLLSIDSAE